MTNKQEMTELKATIQWLKRLLKMSLRIGRYWKKRAQEAGQK